MFKWFLALMLLATFLAFRPFFLEGKIPIPGDILLGGYHPWMDQRWDNRSTLYPVLNNEISDAMTAFYPWRYKAISLVKQGIFPLIDESSHLGYPLFASGLTGILYPLNLSFFLLPFNFAWGALISITPLLSAVFFYLWLKEKKLHPAALIISSLTYAFSAFLSLQVTFLSTAHSVLWLPLILLTVDKLLKSLSIRHFLILVFAVFSSLNSGFFQGTLYILLFSSAYLIFNTIRLKQFKKSLLVISGFTAGLALSAIQILPFIELVSQSSRSLNFGHSAIQTQTFQFFVEYKYLLTTLIPDFFGNPGKWNYWGKPNFYEFNNYAGYLSAIGFIVVLFNSKLRRKLSFFLGALLLTLLLATPNPVSQFPYFQNWPILSSLTPSRLLAITQFCLVTLGAFGLSEIFSGNIKLGRLLLLSGGLVTFYIGAAIFTFLSSTGHWNTAFRNTVYSGAVVTLSLTLILLAARTKHRLLFLALIVLTVFDLLRQSQYHRPFIKEELLYPKEGVVSFLQQNSAGYRFSITQPDLFPANLQSVFGLHIVDGISPLFPDRYNQFITSANAAELNDFLPRRPYMLYYENPHQPLVSLFNIKYILSLKELEDPSLKEVKRENQTIVYENTKVLPKALMVNRSTLLVDPLEAMKYLRSENFKPEEEAVMEERLSNEFSPQIPRIAKTILSEGKAYFETEGDGILIFSEQFLPGWKGYIDGKEAKVVRVNFDLIGLIIPSGSHQVSLVYKPASFALGLIISLITLTSLTTFLLSLFCIRYRQGAKKVKAG